MNENGIFDKIENDIYAVGDIHGDYQVLEHVLLDLAKVVYLENGILKWKKGNNSYVVFCGDLIDRLRVWKGGLSNNKIVDDENSDKLILETLIRLNKEAMNYGGRVIIILGNHELTWNFNHLNHNNFKFVSPEGRYQGREEEWKIGSEWAKKIADNTYSAVRINNVVLVHGGFCREAFINNYFLTSEDPISGINRLVKKYLRTKKEDFTRAFSNELEMRQMRRLLLRTGQGGYKANPFECRYFGEENFRGTCYMNDKIENKKSMFEYLGIPKRGVMVIAHSPQFQKGINEICDGQIWRIDCAMSRAFDIHFEFFYDYIVENLGHPNFLNMVDGKLRELLYSFGNGRKMAILKMKNENGFYTGKEIITQNKLASTYVAEKKVINNKSLLLCTSIDKIILLCKQDERTNNPLLIERLLQIKSMWEKDSKYYLKYEKYRKKYKNAKKKNSR
jgi:hypothetical protein